MIALPVDRVAEGLWTWQARHPEWHPRGFGDLVRSWAAVEGGGVVLVDPLLPEGDAGEEVLAELEEIVAGREVVVAVTIPYHARSAAEVSSRFRGAPVLGHEAVRRRLPAGVSFRPARAGDALPLGIELLAIGSPRRQEQPVWLPQRRALALGDAVVGTDDGLRVWLQREITPQRVEWFRRRLVPTLEPLVALDPEAVLTTHGPPALSGGRAALADALAGGPWNP